MKLSIAAAGLLAAGAAATPAPSKRATITPITIKGNAFFAGDKRFFIRGVDYQPGGPSDPKDPLSDPTVCKRDIKKFEELGLNTIRVYTIDNSKNHDECMQALADAGIYLALDVNSRYYSLNRADIQKSYNKVYLQSVFATIDIFQKYDNTLLFFSANEVLDEPDSSTCAPYVKAVNRDMKSYINARGYRKIPVGYSAADVPANRLEMAQYMNCGPDAVRSDFYAFNDYSWCDPDEFSTTDWGEKVKNFSDYSQPIFLSEYGCNTNKRVFKQNAGLFSDKMWDVYSGGLVYEYTQEEVDFGLVDIKDGKVVEREDFKALKTSFEKTPLPNHNEYKTDGKASECPKKSATWEVDLADDELPVMPEGIDEYFKNGAGDGPGLEGGSQEAGSDTVKMGDATTGTVTQGATEGSSGSSSTTSQGAAAGLHPSSFSAAPLVAGLVVVFSTFLGASLI